MHSLAKKEERKKRKDNYNIITIIRSNKKKQYSNPVSIDECSTSYNTHLHIQAKCICMHAYMLPIYIYIYIRCFFFKKRNESLH